MIENKNILDFYDLDLEKVNYNLTFETVFNRLAYSDGPNKKRFIENSKQELEANGLSLNSDFLKTFKKSLETAYKDDTINKPEIFLIVNESELLGIIGFCKDIDENGQYISEVPIIGLQNNNFVFYKCFFFLIKHMLLKYNKIKFCTESTNLLRETIDKMVKKMNGKIINEKNNMTRYTLRNNDKTMNCTLFKTVS
jgi:hypothetical protein